MYVESAALSVEEFLDLFAAVAAVAVSRVLACRLFFASYELLCRVVRRRDHVQGRGGGTCGICEYFRRRRPCCRRTRRSIRGALCFVHGCHGFHFFLISFFFSSFPKIDESLAIELPEPAFTRWCCLLLQVYDGRSAVEVNEAATDIAASSVFAAYLSRAVDPKNRPEPVAGAAASTGTAGGGDAAQDDAPKEAVTSDDAEKPSD